MADENTTKKRKKEEEPQGGGGAPPPGKGHEETAVDDPRDVLIAQLRQQNAELRSALAAKEEEVDEIDNMDNGDFWNIYHRMPETWQEDRARTLRYLEEADEILFDDEYLPDFNDVPEAILKDEEFIASFLNTKPWWVAFMTKEMQVRFPHLVKQCLLGLIERVQRVRSGARAELHRRREIVSLTSFHTDRSFASHVAEEIQEELWRDRDLVHAWFQAGGDFTPGDFPEALQSDKEVFLWIAEHNREGGGYSAEESFECAAPEILVDRDFMLKCIKLQPALFRMAEDEIKQDLDIILLMFGKTRSDKPKRQRLCLENTDYREYLNQGLERINEELQRDEEYYAGNLRKLAQHSTSPMALFNKDCIQFIASFAVPNGDQMIRLHNAQSNFQHCIDELEQGRERARSL